MSSEDEHLLQQKASATHPAKHSTEWMAMHAALYLVGGILFTLGSVVLFPSLYSGNLMGWAYTIGSLGFFFADGMEWLHPSKSVSCIYHGAYEESFEKQVTPYFQPRGTALGYIQRAEVGWNFFLSFLGSSIYLLGSIWYIPSTHEAIQGTQAFVAGSIFIAISQSWKFNRRGRTNIHDASDGTFRISNLFKYNDLEYYGEVTAEWSTFFGGFLYLLGSIVFLPRYDTDVERTDAATWIFVIGSVFYVIAGCGQAVEYLHKDHSIAVSTSYLTV